MRNMLENYAGDGPYPKWDGVKHAYDTAEREEDTVTVTLSFTDLEALLLDLEARKLPDLHTAPGTDRTVTALRQAWRDAS